MYAGVEWTNPPEYVRAALNSHHPVQSICQCAGPRMAVSCRIITRKAAQRIVSAAFEYAKKRGFKGVTICEKPNVVRETSGMMEEVAKEVAKNYPGIALWSTNIDAQLMWLNKNPEEYNVIRRFKPVWRHSFRRVCGVGGRAGFCGVRQHWGRRCCV